MQTDAAQSIPLESILLKLQAVCSEIIAQEGLVGESRRGLLRKMVEKLQKKMRADSGAHQEFRTHKVSKGIC